MPEERIKKFWAATRQELDRIPLNATLEELTPTELLVTDAHVKTRTVYEVAMTSFDNVRIRAWYLEPAGVPPPGGWPVIMELPPYKEIVPLPLHLALHGFATLSLFPRGQSISRKEWETDRDGKVVHNLLDRDKYYYRGAYMDCIRGIDFLCSRPVINKSRIGTWGFSAGGGLSLVTASLDSRVRAAVAGIPWPCDFQRGARADTFPFVQLRDFVQSNLGEKQAAMETLEYFDVVNLVDAITCPTLIGAAIKDDIHPIESTFAAFTRIPGKKSINVYADLDHEYKTDFTFSGLNWMARHL